MFHLHPIESLELPELAPYRTMKRPVSHEALGIFVAEGEKVVRRLRVLIQRTENDHADEKLLARLSHLLQDEGQSPFEVIVAMPEGKFRVSHPEARVRLTTDLERQLREDFGPECVLVEQA